MTINSTTRKAGPYAGDNVTTAFPFAYKVFAASDLYVVRADAVGTETVLVLTTHYTVALNADQNANPGGTVTLVTALATGATLTLSSSISNLQQTDLTNQGGFYPEVVTNALDKLTILIQQASDAVSRSLKTAISTPAGVSSTLPAPVAYKVLGWNGTGTAIENTDPSGTSSFAADLLTSIGASLVGWIHQGVGAVTRTLQARLRDTTSVKDYGGVCDGVTDDYAAVVLALNSMSNGTLLIPGNCKISAPIPMKTNVDVLVTGSLDATGLSSAFNWTGVSVSTTSLTAQANVSDVVIAVTSAAGLTTNDYVVLENNVFHTFPGTWPGIDSHFAQVLSVAGNNVTINNPVPETFPIASSLLRKITVVENANANVKKIIGAPTDAFYMKWAVGNKCSGGVNPIGKNSVIFFSSWGNKATRIQGINPVGNTAPGWGYGGLFDQGAADNVIEKSYFENIREIAHGFNARRNAVRRNVIIRPYDSGVNTHGLGSVDAMIDDNTIMGSQQYGVAIGQAATSGWWPDVGTKVRRNLIVNCAKNAIREQQFDAPIETATVIDQNDIRNAGSSNTAGLNHAIAVYGSATTTSIVNPRITRNKVRGTGVTGGCGVYITGLSAKRTVTDDNDIDTTGGCGVRWDTAGGDHSADGNVLRNIGERGFQSNGDERIILGRMNRVESSTLGTYLGIGLAAPTSGTWKQGDIVWNMLPSAGSPMGWACVAAPLTFQALAANYPTSTWSLGQALELSAVGNALFGNGLGNMSVTSNCYYNSGWKFASAGYASRYQQTAGVHTLQVSTISGVNAGDPITWSNKFTLDALGNLTMLGTILPQQAPTASAPAYVKGAIYFDTTLNKLRVGGASAWETITST